MVHVLNVLKNSHDRGKGSKNTLDTRVYEKNNNKEYRIDDFNFYTRDKIDLNGPRDELFKFAKENIITSFFGKPKVDPLVLYKNIQTCFIRGIDLESDDSSDMRFNFSVYYLHNSDVFRKNMIKVISREKALASILVPNVSPYSNDFISTLKSCGEISLDGIHTTGSSIVKIIEQCVNSNENDLSKIVSFFALIPTSLNLRQAIIVYVALEKFNKIKSLGELENFLNNKANNFYLSLEGDFDFKKFLVTIDYFFSKNIHDVKIIGRQLELKFEYVNVSESEFSLKMIFISGVIRLLRELMSRGVYTPRDNFLIPDIFFTKCKKLNDSYDDYRPTMYEATVRLRDGSFYRGYSKYENDAIKIAQINAIIGENLKLM